MRRLFLFALSFCIGTFASAQLVDVIVEEFGTAGGTYPAGYTTYRVYARLQDPTDYLATVYGIGATMGDPDHSMCFGQVPGVPGEVPYWNHELGGVIPDQINLGLCGIIPEICFDSYITVGGAGMNTDYISTPVDLFNPIFDVAPFGATGCIDDGGYYSFDGGFGTGPDNRVLILQATCPTGQLKYAINIQIYDEGSSLSPIFYCHTKQGEPGLIGGNLEIPYPCKGLVYPIDFECPGCNDPAACNYDPFTIGGGECFYAPDCEAALGCIDPVACNYSPEAIWDWENECVYPGCTDPVACNYQPDAGCDDGSCGYIEGCLDPAACNFEPNPDCVVPCIPSGCTDPSACNYSPNAGCDDGSCNYGDDLIAQLFLDANGDGSWSQNFFDEPTINVGSIEIVELGITFFPNSEGLMVFPDLPLGPYTLIYTDPNGVYALNDGMGFNVTLPTCNGLNIPLQAANNTLLQVSGPCCIWMMDIHCQFGFNPGLWVQNLGSVPLNGTFTMTFDPVLVPTYLGNAVPYDEYADGVMTWNISDQAPGSSLLYQCHINGPGVDYIGEVFPFDMHLVLNDDEGNIIYENSWVLEPTVVCAYDPNDKYTAEPGYTEEHHFVPQEDEIEYRVRFQNTGNFPAETVIIRDTLDVEHLDLESFYPVFGSHSFSTIVEPNGAVTFTFSNIMLPDSASDEPGSQGYVVYRVRPHSEVQHMDVIHNTAYIFFDGNPPIVTNTTWHTIMDCNELGTITGPEMICEGEMAEFTFPDDFVETIDWTVNEDEAGSGTPLIYSADTPGDFVVGVTVLNPLCEISQNTNLEVNPLPGTVITLGDGILTAPEGASWQWYYDGELIEGAVEQTYEPGLYSGLYQVYVVSPEGCGQMSEQFDYSSIVDVPFWDEIVYPNPMSDYVILNIGNQVKVDEVKWFNSEGEMVREDRISRTGEQRLERRQMTSGYYLLNFYFGNDLVGHTSIIVK